MFKQAKLPQLEEHERNLIKQLKYMENEFSIDNLNSILFDNTDGSKENLKKNGMYYYNLIYLKNHNADLLKLSDELKNELEIIRKRIVDSQNLNYDIEREIKIVNKEKIEIFKEKEMIEEEMAKIKVSQNLI
jgi:hypothetical protein